MNPGKSVGVLVITLLITLGSIFFLSTVQADKPITKYCVDGGPYCGDKEADCKALLESVSRDHKCLEVTIN